MMIVLRKGVNEHAEIKYLGVYNLEKTKVSYWPCVAGLGSEH